MKLKVIDHSGYTVGTVTAVTNSCRTGLVIQGVDVTIDGLRGKFGKTPSKNAGLRRARAVGRLVAQVRKNGPVRVIQPAREAA